MSNGDVAQLARAFGSYPKCQEFESPHRYQYKKSKQYRLMSILFFCFTYTNYKRQCRKNNIEKAQLYKKKFIKYNFNYKLKLKKGVLSNKNV